MTDEDFSDFLQTGNDRCFLCGTQRTPITLEHVFPKWLQNRHGLWNQKIGLLNETKIPYRNLLIPCCSTCNQEDLARLESTISTAVLSGYEACSAIDERLLYLWSGKLFYGILRKEITLSRERSKQDPESIFPKELLKSFSDLHLFLQGIRGAHEFPANVPYSVLVCNLHDLGEQRNFCFRDSLFNMTLAIRMGEIGIIIALEDAGLTKISYGRYVEAVAGRKLHPIQFDELSAKVLYQVSRIEGGITYITSKSRSGSQPIFTHIMSNGRLRQQSQEEFAQVLKVYVSNWLKGKGVETQWFVPPNLVPTWMTDETGALLFRSPDEWETSD